MGRCHTWTLTSLGVVALTLVGCSQLYKARRVDEQHQAGSVHFAVLSVAPWQEYAKSLQPNFKIDEESALRAVVPSTRMLEESLLSVLQASLGITDVASRFTASRRTVEQADPDTLSTSTTVEEKMDPTRGDVMPNIGLALDNTDPGPQQSVLDQEVGIDPMLRYWAATALFQEVRLLNQYIRAAAVRDGFVPYVVRLQVSLMPSARGEPYDVYTTFSFFSTKPEEDPDSGTRQAPVTLLRGGSLSDPSPAAVKETPQIIPLMSTDNLEATMHSRVVENVQQLAGALFLMSGGTTGGLDGQATRQDRSAVVGRDLNSLLTVARVSDNSLRVRLGASQQASSNYAMVPRNHNITVLLMVPEGVSRTIQVVAKTVMVDAETGEELSERSSEEIDRQLTKITTRYGLEQVDPVVTARLLELAQRNDQRDFFSELERGVGRDFPHGRSLWLDLVSLMIGSQYSATEFEVPEPDYDLDVEAHIPEQNAVLLDDGRIAAVVLSCEGNPDPAQIGARVLVQRDDAELPFIATTVAGTERGTELYLEFPSLAAWGISKEGPEEMKLSLSWRGNVLEMRTSHLVQPPPERVPERVPETVPATMPANTEATTAKKEGQ